MQEHFIVITAFRVWPCAWGPNCSQQQSDVVNKVMLHMPPYAAVSNRCGIIQATL